MTYRLITAGTTTRVQPSKLDAARVKAMVALGQVGDAVTILRDRGTVVEARDGEEVTIWH